METLFWHDYETFGRDPRRDPASQFAGVRTDFELNDVGVPVQCYNRPTPDFLPDPFSCAITGITPQHALQHGLSEVEFCARIHHEISKPGTCSVGYKSVGFDDEVTRGLLYRNFYDPYEREWKHGNSRWDLIDVLRMAQALRPEGVQWPLKEDGSPSFALEALTKANGIEHEGAHDALADVRATIALARLVRTKQRKLYDYLFKLRHKDQVRQLLNLNNKIPVVYVSGIFAASRGCLGIALPLCRHPDNENGVLVVDLRADPSLLLELDAAELRRRLFQASAERPEGEERIPITTIHINRCPALAPLSVLTDSVLRRHRMDLTVIEKRRQKIQANAALVHRLQQVFADAERPKINNVDMMLYSGGFFGDHDRRVMQKIRDSEPEHLPSLAPECQDPRLPELLFRYRARNFPESLNESEKKQWQEHCRNRLLGGIPGAGVSLAEFRRLLSGGEISIPPALQQSLVVYAEELAARCGLADNVAKSPALSP